MAGRSREQRTMRIVGHWEETTGIATNAESLPVMNYCFSCTASQGCATQETGETVDRRSLIGMRPSVSPKTVLTSTDSTTTSHLSEHLYCNRTIRHTRHYLKRPPHCLDNPSQSTQVDIRPVFKLRNLSLLNL